jgi:hypothetical protein
MFIGTNLNGSEDALDLGDYSDRWINTYLPYRNSRMPADIETEMQEDLKAILEQHCSSINESAQRWGWKEPRGIYLLPFFHSQFPQLKFLHVVRDGRDMAYSSNQNQLRKHGRTLLRWRDSFRSIPEQSILLWSCINLMTLEYAKEHLRGRYLRVRFEDLCADPVPTIEQMFEFFDLHGDAHKIAELEVSAPATLGRWRRERSAEKVSRIGNEALRKLGYA